MLDESLNGLPGPVHYEDVKTLTAPATTPLTVDIEIAATNIGDGALPSHIAVGLLPVEIVPAEDQPGKTGDQIPSNNGAAGEKHYVSPKKSAEIADDFVVIIAKGIEKELFEQVLEWEEGEAVPNEPLKRRINRDETGKTPVKLKTKEGGQEVDFMNVWIVWSEITSVDDGIAGKGFYSRQEDDTGERFWVVPNPENMRKFKCTIAPPEIITANDRPSLDGAKQKPVPGSDQVYPINPLVQADSATNKWDMSRQVEITLANPGGILRADLQPTLPAAFCVNQPAIAGDPVIVLDKVMPFPQEAREGNDDPPKADEDTNPYQARNLVGQEAALNHEIGEIASYDAPSFPVQDDWGINDRQFGIRANFNEFARLELWDGNRDAGEYWFRISDNFEWHHLLRAKFTDSTGKWINFGSSAGVGHK